MMETSCDGSLQQEYEKFFEAESDFMPAKGYAISHHTAMIRMKALQIISEHSKSEDFDAFVPYLAMNYFDRFISRQEIPNVRGNLREDFELLVVCCLTLAWKSRTGSFHLSKFLEERNVNINLTLVLRMEALIVDELEWRLRTVTPCCFVEYFLPHLTLRDPSMFKRQIINKIIIQAQGDITFTKYKPSIIAASALLATSLGLYPSLFPMFRERILSLATVRKEDLLECLVAMDKLIKQKNIVLEDPGTEIALDWVNPDDEPISTPLFQKAISTPLFQKAISQAFARRFRSCNIL